MKLLRFAAFLAAAVTALAVDPPPVADFATLDWNTDSLRRAVTADDVSPRNYLNQVSAWYFGRET